MVRCDSYDTEEVLAAVRRSVELLGGLGRFVSPGHRVVLKPNLLHPSRPSKAVTTHPEVVYAVAVLLREHGCEVIIAESAGGGSMFTEGGLRRLYSTCEIDQAAQRAGVGLNFDTSHEEVPNPSGKVVKRFRIIAPAARCDAIVSVSKAKTHVLTTMTGGTKNLFGILPGMEKPSFHGRLPRVDEFSEMIVDLNELMRPRLQIMDAVVGMEGDGPQGGDPRKIGAILASGNYAALDIVAARLMALPPDSVPTIRAAAARGVVPEDLSVEVLGDDLDALLVKDFKHPATMGQEGFARSRFMRAFARMARAYALRPVVQPSLCVGCGECVRACPKGAIRMVRGKARVKYRDCIRCYCCHEMCTRKAIRLERGWAGKIMVKVTERGGR